MFQFLINLWERLIQIISWQNFYLLFTKKNCRLYDVNVPLVLLVYDLYLVKCLDLRKKIV